MTSLQLNSKWGPCPPDGYRYVFPEDGYLVHAWTYVDWVAAARSHLLANQQDIPQTLEQDMQTQLCLTLPPGWCAYDDDARPRPNTSLTWSDVAAGLQTFTKWIAQGCSYVPQEEVERRATICSRCYLNTNVQGCAGCQQAVQEVVRNRSSKSDHLLRACAVCKCFLKAAVHFPVNTMVDEEGSLHQQMYPSFCWKKIGGENYEPQESAPRSQAKG